MKIRTSILARLLAWILIAVSGMGLVGSGLLAIGMMSEGFYERTYESLRKESFSTYSDRYSARVLEYLNAEEETNQEYFADKNFKYGVIKADFLSDIEGLDLNDSTNYIDTNFDFAENLELEDMHVFQCTINENTQFVSQHPNSLWGYYWISNTSDNWHTYDIDMFAYDVSGIIYAQAGKQYYPVPKVRLFIYDNNRNTTIQRLVFDGKKGAYIMEDETPTEFGEQQYDAALDIYITPDTTTKEVLKLINDLSDAAKVDGMNLTWLDGTLFDRSKWSSIQFTTYEEVYDESDTAEVMGSEEQPLDQGSYAWTVAYVDFSYTAFSEEVLTENWDKEIRMSIYGPEEMYIYVKPTDMKSDTYFVLSSYDNGVAYDADLTQGETDLFGQYDIIVGTLYSMRYQVFAIFFSCLAVYLLAFVFLCCVAGHKKGQTELVQTWSNRIPLEAYAGAFVFGEAFCMTLMDEMSRRIGGLGDVFYIVVTAVFILFAGLLLTLTGLELITRIKLRILWKNTICYWAISKLFGGMKQAGAFIAEHTSLVWKAILLIGINAVADFVICLFMYENSGLGFFLFALKCIGLLLVALSAASQLRKLKDAGEHMAKGDLTYRVDTNGLFWDFKKHGENLNSISEGLAIAVDERMKSERFKTELITNVSHDIKTPLTSIINYVDLIQKEEVGNEKIEEYLEVLERQSKRLKKLLEDLLEASKASAGTLAVGFETLEAGVFMVQTVGEFEEKTAAQDLELIIKKPDEPVYINADGRHFWRVIDNLMNNICKYAQPNTRVYINLEATQDEVYITFRNTSRYPLNISSEELMERFVRGDESRNTEGSGLGLSIAQSLMELMHGQFELIVDGDLFKVVLKFKRVIRDFNITH